MNIDTTLALRLQVARARDLRAIAEFRLAQLESDGAFGDARQAYHGALLDATTAERLAVEMLDRARRA